MGDHEEAVSGRRPVNNLIFTLLPGADYEDVELKLEAELKNTA